MGRQRREKIGEIKNKKYSDFKTALFHYDGIGLVAVGLFTIFNDCLDL